MSRRLNVEYASLKHGRVFIYFDGNKRGGGEEMVQDNLFSQTLCNTKCNLKGLNGYNAFIFIIEGKVNLSVGKSTSALH